MYRLSVSRKACVLSVFCAATAIAAPAQTFTTLHSFNGTDGISPQAGLVQSTGGKLYGTTAAGGAGGCGVGCGTVFTITPAGTLTTIHSFHGMDGNFPQAGLVQGRDGNFYGTTVNGGHGYGTVFKITPSGVLTMLYSFCPQAPCSDGSHPYAGLLQSADGDFYGTTGEGGTAGRGTLFKITPSGALTTLHKFDGADGAFPTGGLIQGPDGNFYGTTQLGGNQVNGRGNVFKMTPGGVLTTLHDFDGTDGSSPYGGLVQGRDGNFYGTTYTGGLAVAGCGGGCGTVFKMTRSGKLTTLHKFDKADGRNSQAGLIQATDGNFYGTTFAGGPDDDGTIFKITPDGTLTTLYNFCSQPGCPDGDQPYAALVQDTNGILYGTTDAGGAGDNGTVFSLSVSLGPFVETEPVSGNIGAAVNILGANLTGATSVTFNGTPATFTVKLRSEITTTVPTGPTTGTVQVVTPGGTLLSNVPFRVLP